MHPWAVFDVDGTLLPHLSMESAFQRHLFGNRFLKSEQIFRHLSRTTSLLMKKQVDIAFYQNKAYLRGLPADVVNQQASEAFQQRIAPFISPQGSSWVHRCRQEGYRILIMTGAPDFLARQLVPIFDPDHLISTVMEIQDDHYTGRITGLHPFGIRKTMLLQRAARKLSMDFTRSVVFANHATDQDHMRIFGRAVAVNPSIALQKTANLRDWEMMHWQ